MAIATARMQISGTWYNLTKNASTGNWEGTATAPNTTSFHLSGGYYPVTIEATNQAGAKSIVTSTDPTVGSSLKLAVKERVRPVAAITSQSSGAYLGSNQAPISFSLRDETSGSGVKLATLALTLDGTTYGSASTGMVCTAVFDGYNCTYTPPSALADGSHTVNVSVQDNDENASVAVAVTYTIDTVPPVLNITSPIDGLVTEAAVQSVSGVTNDAAGSAVAVEISLNGTDQGAVSVGADGAFSKAITLREGENSIEVTSTDRAGRHTSMTLTATLDTTAPVISSVSVSPNPADAGATLNISVVIA